MADEKVVTSRLDDLQQYEIVVERLQTRGVNLIEIAEITFDLQKKYIETLSLDYCLEHVKKVIKKKRSSTCGHYWIRT